VKRVVCALLFVATACGSSAAPEALRQIATSSTTAEEARAIDGPLMRYPETSSTSGKVGNLLQGVLDLDGGEPRGHMR